MRICLFVCFQDGELRILNAGGNYLAGREILMMLGREIAKGRSLNR